MKIISGNINFVAAFGKKVLTLQDENTSNILPFNHKKAEAKVFLHACNIVLTSGAPHVLIKTVENDVHIIARCPYQYYYCILNWRKCGKNLVMGCTESAYLFMVFTSNLDMVDQQDFYFPTHLPEVTKDQPLMKVRRKLLEQCETILWRQRKVLRFKF